MALDTIMAKTRQSSWVGRFRNRLTAQALITVAGVAIPVSLFPIHNLAHNLFYSLIIAGIVWAAFSHSRLYDKEDKRLGVALLGFVVTAWTSYAVNGFSSESWDAFQKGFAPYLGLPFIYLLFRSVGRTPVMMWWVTTVGAGAFGLLAFGDVLEKASDAHFVQAVGAFVSGRIRAEGGGNAVVFGGASAILTLGALTSARYFRSLGYWGISVWLLALLLGLSGVILSGTRGAWLVLPGAFLLLAAKWNEIGGIRRRVALISALLIFFAVSLIPAVQYRLNLAATEVTEYLTKPSDKPGQGSFGKRMDTWQVALEAFSMRPVFGFGTGQWREAWAAARPVALTSKAGELEHPHNIFIAALALRGFVGFAAEFVFLGLLVYGFARRVGARDPVVSGLGLGGLLTAAGVLVLGATDMPLDWSRDRVILFSFLFVGWWAAMREAENAPLSERLAKT